MSDALEGQVQVIGEFWYLKTDVVLVTEVFGFGLTDDLPTVFHGFYIYEVLVNWKFEFCMTGEVLVTHISGSWRKTEVLLMSRSFASCKVNQILETQATACLWTGEILQSTSIGYSKRSPLFVGSIVANRTCPAAMTGAENVK